ncbi:MAG: alpha/beta hydrolase [Planctomycetes bacterium]|nr:alpha/beta hydrolase [Planctomycetota bacterium]
MAGGAAPPVEPEGRAARRPLPRRAKIALALLALLWAFVSASPFVMAALGQGGGFVDKLIPIRLPATLVLVVALVSTDIWRRGGSLRLWARDVFWNRRVAIEALAVALFLVTLPFWARTSLSYAFLFPWTDYLAVPAEEGLACEEVSLPREGTAPLTGWFLPASGERAARAAVLLSNGNAANMSQLLDHASILHDLGCSVLLYDYQGFGRSPGSRDVGSLAGDARTAAAWLRGKAAPLPLVAFGISMGTQPTARLAAEKRCDAVILESVFQADRELAARFRWIPPLVWALRPGIPEEFDMAGNLEVAGSMPKLFLHGTDDNLTPYPRAQALFDDAPGPKRWVEFPGAGHLEPVLDRRAYREALRAFLDAALPTPRY